MPSMVSRRTDSCRAPATRFKTTPARCTSGSRVWHPSTWAAAVRVVLVTSTERSTGAFRSLASSALEKLPSASIPSKRPSVSLDDGQVRIGGVGLDEGAEGHGGVEEEEVQIPAGAIGRTSQPGGVDIIGPLLEGGDDMPPGTKTRRESERKECLSTSPSETRDE